MSRQHGLDFRIFLSRQFVVFLIVGVVAASAHWLYRFVANMFLSYVHALFVAYSLSLVSGFLLTRQFVFPLSSKPIARQVGFFVLFHLSMLPIVLGLSYGLSEFVFLRFMETASARGLAHAIAVLSPAMINFVLQKYVAFDA